MSGGVVTQLAGDLGEVVERAVLERDDEVEQMVGAFDVSEPGAAPFQQRVDALAMSVSSPPVDSGTPGWARSASATSANGCS